MTGGRCYQREMTVSGAGCISVTEGPGLLSSPSSPFSVPSSSGRRSLAVEGSGRSEPSDLIAQALKTLALHSPFDTDEDAARKPTLPAGVASFLFQNPESRKNDQRNHGEPGRKKASRPPAATTVWDQNEEYFRPLTQSDIGYLHSIFQFTPCPRDSCLSIPNLGKKAEVLDTGSVEVSSSDYHYKLEPSVEEKPKEMERAEAGEERATTVDDAGTGGDSYEISSSPSSMSWILNSRHRILLTSERPNKKRKLLAGDTCLEKLLQLPNLNELRCDMCCLGPTCMKSNKLVSCDSCKVTVHQKCYGILEVPMEAWLCSWCKHLEVLVESVKRDGVEHCSRPCLLCPKEGGALKASRRDNNRDKLNINGMKYVHLFCSLWAPEVYVENIRTMEPVLNVGGIQETRTKLVCYLCKVKHGVCVRCSHGTCRTSFHPLCAREAKHQMEIWGKFGCDYVELRAFCSKHSSPKDTHNFIVKVADHSSLARPQFAVLPMIKFKLKRIPSERDKNLTRVEVQSSERMVKNENFQEMDASTPGLRREVGGESELKNITTNGVGGSLNSIPSPSSPDPALVLRKLIDRGKVNVDDVASAMGISTNSLEASLLGETTSFSPGLRLKIVKWLQDSAHILKATNGPTISSGHGMSAAKVTCPSAPGDLKVSGLEVSDAAVIKSLSLQKRTSSSIEILKDNETQRPSAAFNERNCHRIFVEGNSERPVVISSEDIKEVVDKSCSIHKHNYLSAGLNLSEMVIEGTSKPCDLSPSLDPPREHKGHPVEMESNDLSEAHHQETSDVAGVNVPDTFQKDFQSNPGCGGDVVVSCSKPDLIIGESSPNYVHPLIRSKMAQMKLQNDAFSEHKFGGSYFIGRNASVSVSCDQSLLSSGTEINHALGKPTMHQLVFAKTMGVMDLSPDDEVEAELLYLQSMLLDKVVTVKHSCEYLISRVVRYIAKEMDAVSRRGWDQALVNQFMREVKEAKKKGRKERKHKEAKAVLAAAEAEAAASSRNPSLRKDANDDFISHHQSPMKVSAPRAKESSRFTMGKVSLEQPGICQIPYFLLENALSCDICKRAETILNRVSVCSICKVSVHLDCYRRLKNPIGPWKCELCEEITSQPGSPRNEAAVGNGTSGFDFCCGLCGFRTGAFRKSTDGQWVHAFCAEWLLESSYKRGQQNPVEGMDTDSKVLNLRPCSICHRTIGVCLKCSSGHCQITFHPSCARNSGMYMNIKINGGRLQHKAYCEKHSVEQRETDNRDHGTDENERIRQIRGELERVRLLCERVSRREKLKKELVVCAHDILASQRDCVSMSVLTRGPFFPPGVSSESATTSINNRSYSGVMERSEDITVDSTVSGINKARWSVHTDIDRKTDDSSTSQLSLKRKISSRISIGGKQLPQKRAFASPLQNSVLPDREQSSKIKKTQTFQKELVMTSDQASLQNQRLPKGFAYIPVGSLSIEKPTTSDLEPNEPP